MDETQKSQLSAPRFAKGHFQLIAGLSERLPKMQLRAFQNSGSNADFDPQTGAGTVEIWLALKTL